MLAMHSATTYATLGDWIAREAVGFTTDSAEAFDAAVDRVIAALGDSVGLLGLGEAMHGGEEILLFRNRLFQRLVAAHGYTAIAVESSFTRSVLANEYIAGRGEHSIELVCERGFSHGFGRLAGNRQLIEWMRAYNADAARPAKLRFYGFDAPTEMTVADSPGQALRFVLDYLDSLDAGVGEARRGHIEELIGPDADWENPAAAFEPAKSIGLSPAATTLRIATEELLTDLARQRPELAAGGGLDRYLEAVRHAALARQMLTYHAGMAQPSDARIARLLGIRDLIMADNLVYAMARERHRAGAHAAGGAKVLAFAHNMHLQRGVANWQLGPHALAWWPAGAHVNAQLGPGYAVIGCGLGEAEAVGIGQPEPGTLEAHLLAAPGPARLVPTRRGRHFDAACIEKLPTRSTTNPGYFPLAARSLSDFDFLLML